MKEYEFRSLKIEVSGDVFYPTKTSTVILDYLSRAGVSYERALDLGCGAGIVALFMAKEKISEQVFASDVCNSAVRDTRRNAENLGLTVNTKVCSLLDGWVDTRFDLIVNDVSGISAELAKLTPWFKDKVSCATGEDGVDLTMKIIENVSDHLNENGTFMTPLLGLSNYQRALTRLNERFRSVELVAEREFVLPAEIGEQTGKLKQLIERNSIEVRKKFGLYTWPMRLYIARH